jgi:polyamine oxidase
MRLSRRAFTIGCGTLAASQLLPGCSSGTDAPKERIVVVGAGMAGLAAARRDVTVLEARDRIGGRTWTDSSLGVPIDLGAAWIHGTEGNPLTELAEQVGARRVETDYDTPVLFRDGVEVDPEDVQTTLKRWGEITEELVALGAQAGLDESVANGLADVADRDDPLIEWCVASEIVGEYATDPDELSLKWFGNEGEFDGPDVILPGGYSQLAQHLARGLTIRLGNEVSRVTYDDTGVRLETSQGVVEADRAIVTVPLGVLKAGTIAFDPPLPEEKRLAIEGLGFGLLDKVVLKFDQPFWPDTDVIGLVGRDQPVSLLINGEVFADTPLLVGPSRRGAERTAPERRDRHALGGGPIRPRLLQLHRRRLEPGRHAGAGRAARTARVRR